MDMWRDQHKFNMLVAVNDDSGVWGTHARGTFHLPVGDHVSNWHVIRHSALHGGDQAVAQSTFIVEADPSPLHQPVAGYNAWRFFIDWAEPAHPGLGCTFVQFAIGVTRLNVSWIRGHEPQLPIEPLDPPTKH